MRLAGGGCSGAVRDLGRIFSSENELHPGTGEGELIHYKRHTSGNDASSARTDSSSSAPTAPVKSLTDSLFLTSSAKPCMFQPRMRGNGEVGRWRTGGQRFGIRANGYLVATASSTSAAEEGIQAAILPGPLSLVLAYVKARMPKPHILRTSAAETLSLAHAKQSRFVTSKLPLTTGSTWHVPSWTESVMKPHGSARYSWNLP